MEFLVKNNDGSVCKQDVQLIMERLKTCLVLGGCALVVMPTGGTMEVGPVVADEKVTDAKKDDVCQS